MLLSEDEVFHLLRCPKTGARLRRIDDGTLAAVNDPTIGYSIVDGYPVLVDFDDSVLVEDHSVRRNLESPITRRRKSVLMRFLTALVSPPKQVTRKNVSHFLQSLKRRDGAPNVLIVGGGTIGQGMQPLYDDPDIQLISFDIYATPHVQFIADACNLPLAEESLDAVVVQAVLEHVLDPQRVVRQIHRVLKPNGLVYAETPFLQHVHEGAYDFTRFTESGHRYLFHQFKLIRSGATAGPGTQMLWSVDHLVRSLCRSRTAGKVAKLAFFWLRFLDDFVCEEYAIDAASGVFFLGQKNSAALSAQEIIAHYKGAQS